MNARPELRLLREQAEEADRLHLKSRELLVSAVRAGAAAGLSQRDIASAVGRSQPEVSRLLRFHGRTVLAHRLTRKRADVLTIAARHGASNVRVFGSVSKGADRDGSDIDLLVDLTEETSLFGLSRLEGDLSELLGVPVDVVPASGLRPHLADEVLRGAVPL